MRILADAPRIALLSEHASPVALLGGEDSGGQNVYVDEVARGLGAIGYRVDVFTRQDAADAPRTIDWAPNVRVVNVPAGPPRAVPKDDLWPLMPEFLSGIRAFSSREGIRHDLVHGNFWMSGWAAVELGAATGRPVVQIFHATGVTKRREQGDADTSPRDRIAVEREVVRRADRLIAQCPEEERELICDYGAPAGRVRVIPSAVDIERFRPEDRFEARRRLGLPDLAPVVVYVGRMLPRKDVRNLVRALGMMKRQAGAGEQLPLLLLVGGETAEPDPVATPEIGVLRQLAAEWGVEDRLRFTGRRQRDELRWCYSAADVAVSTPWYEPFGLTPLEAMACGIPVIGSAVGGISFTVRDGETGFLVQPRNPGELADRLRRVLSDEPLRLRLGSAARARVVKHFTWRTVATRTASLYEELLDGPMGPHPARPASPLAEGSIA